MSNRYASLRSFLLLGVPVIVCVIVPVIIVVVDLIPMNVVKDYVYVVCTMLQTAVVTLGLFWWQRKIRKEDQEKERQKAEEKKQKAEEEKQKADTEKIIAIFSSDNYGEAEEAHRILKKNLDALESRKINTGQSTRTELDVLVYMCHEDNRSKFDKSEQLLLWADNSNALGLSNYASFQSAYSSTDSERHEYGRKNVMSDVHKIRNFFQEFRYQLNFDQECPGTIKSKFSSKVIEMGKTIYPLMFGENRKLIDEVSNYFNPTNSVQTRSRVNATPTEGNVCPHLRTLCCCSCAVDMETREDEDARASLSPDSNITTPQDQQALQNTSNYSYPGLSELENEIPYIEFFRYKDAKMDCNIECQYSNLQNLEKHVEENVTEIMAKKDEIGRKILIELLGEEGLPQGQGITSDEEITPEYLLHLIRTLMLKIKYNQLDSNRREAVIEYVRKVDCSLVTFEAAANKSIRAVDNIQSCIDDLKRRHEYILGLENTHKSLNTIAKEIRALIDAKGSQWHNRKLTRSSSL